MIPGLRVGHAHCPVARTGVTVLLPDRPAIIAADVRGGGPGTRETDALEPSTLVERAHALVLAGGSVFGLAAADEVALLLARQGIGLEVAGLSVPVVPAAILFDLGNGGDKGWARAGGAEPPYRRLAAEALDALTQTPDAGPIGAGFGARAGSRPGGVGIAHATLDGGGRVSALVAVNSFGEVSEGAPPDTGAVPFPKIATGGALAAASTCIGAVATDVPLTRAAARRVAMMAHDGLARAIRPIHTPFDGDALFTLGLSPETPARVDPLLLAELGTRAADCVARAVRAAVTANP
jgi:L-aminopeptidase/D-esterase-like protein